MSERGHASDGKYRAAEVTRELARRLRISNDHREGLYRYILRCVTGAAIGVIAAVVFLGLGG